MNCMCGIFGLNIQAAWGGVLADLLQASLWIAVPIAGLLLLYEWWK